MLLSLALSATAQEPSPAPSSTPTPPATVTVIAVVSPTPSATPSASPTVAPAASPTPSLLKKTGVKILFIPPPMEGTISLGIYDSTGKLVRVLHREAGGDEFVAALDGYITHWDGLDDSGKAMPPGHYSARGYMVGAVTVRAVDPGSVMASGSVASPLAIPAPSASPWSSPQADLIEWGWIKFPNGRPFEQQAKIRVTLLPNPLDRDRAGSAELSAGLDADGKSWLELSDGLPLKEISPTPGCDWVSIGQVAPGEPLLVLQSGEGRGLEAFAITKVADMMAFDCGGFDFPEAAK